MPIYEYYCPQCKTKFEALKGMGERHSNPCPQCNNNCKLLLSACNWSIFNPFTKDGEGFSSKYVRREEIKEMNQELRQR